MVGKKILSVGHVEFPDLGQAQVQRQLLMARAIILEGFDITVLCRYGIHSESDGIMIKKAILKEFIMFIAQAHQSDMKGYQKNLFETPRFV